MRTLWERQTANGEPHDIYEIKALGPALILWNWGFALRDHLWVHFIDNDAALASLAKGSSSVKSGEVIVAYTHELAARLGIWSWHDRVDTAANPVDKLSRGVMASDWDLMRITFPKELTARLKEYSAQTSST